MYEHDTVFQMPAAVVGFPEFAIKVSDINEMRQEKRRFMRMKLFSPFGAFLG
jgi:hypothetical protein